MRSLIYTIPFLRSSSLRLQPHASLLYVPILFLLCNASFLCQASGRTEPPKTLSQGFDDFSSDEKADTNGESFLRHVESPSLSFNIVRPKQGEAFIVIHDGTKKTYMPDERISVPQNNPNTPYGKNFVLAPGQTFKSYKFFLSPDRKWLLVQRGGIGRFATCYLYRRTSKQQMMPVHVEGKILDDAAIAACAREAKVDAKLLGGGARVSRVYECRWNLNRIVLHVEASSYWYDAKSEHTTDVHGMWLVTYNLKSGRMVAVPTSKY